MSKPEGVKMFSDFLKELSGLGNLCNNPDLEKIATRNAIDAHALELAELKERVEELEKLTQSLKWAADGLCSVCGKMGMHAHAIMD